jgi:hypothetical protein
LEVMVGRTPVAPRVVVAPVARLVVAQVDRMSQMRAEQVVVAGQDILVVGVPRVVP